MSIISICRETKETRVKMTFDLKNGPINISTGIGFFDHMLELFAFHGGFSLTVSAQGDLETGFHHTVEDVGIVLGQTLSQAIGNKVGLARYGDIVLPMDEALVLVACDLSGRPFLATDLRFPSREVAGFSVELVEEFLRSFVNHAKITLHVKQLAGTNTHHIIEAVFKGFGRALRQSCVITESNVTPSSKGVL